MFVFALQLFRKPLHFAALTNSKDLAKLLVEKGANLNAQNAHKNTPLHEAAKYGAVDVAEVLLDVGADQDLKGERGETPQEVSSRFRSVDVAALFYTHVCQPCSGGSKGGGGLFFQAKKQRLF
jgi:ankyrin repeat protein